MMQHFTSRNGYDRWVDMERELSIYIGQDGSALISLPDAYSNLRLLSPSETAVAVKNLEEST